jgi:hypoxanthine phosphoribosyltransferase
LAEKIIGSGYRELTTITVLKGAQWFSEKLRKKLELSGIKVGDAPMRVSSYGKDTESSGKIELILEPRENLKGKDLLIVEDIIDTGTTMDFLLKYLWAKKPRSLKVCVLLNKPSRRKTEIKIDYVGFEVPDKFLIGCGLDYQDEYRDLPYVGYIEE